MTNDTFCQRVNHELIIKAFNDKVEGALCCKMKPTFDLKDNKTKEKIIDDLNNNIRNYHCVNCWKQEDNGIKSWRQIGNEISLRHNAIELYLDITCDAACIYCTHRYSSKWKSEILNANDKDKEILSKRDNFDDIFTLNKNVENYTYILSELEKIGKKSKKNINKPTIITLLGGEPLLTPFIKSNTVKDIVESFYRYNNKEAILDLVIQTNGNTPNLVMDKTFKIINKLKNQYKNLKITFSLSMESVGKLAEYIRYGVSWNQFDKNVNKIMQSDNFITFNMATTNVSLTHSKKFMQYVFDKCAVYNKKTNITFNLVRYPLQLSIALLPTEYDYILKELINEANNNRNFWFHEKVFNNFIKQVNIARTVLGSNIDQKLINEGKEYFNYIKNNRNMDLKDYNNEIAKYFGI